MAAQLALVQVAQIDPVQGYGAGLGVVEATQELDQGGLSRPVATDYGGDTPARDLEIQPGKHVPLTAWVTEAQPPTTDALGQGRRGRDGLGRVPQPGLQGQEGEQVAQEQAVGIDLTGAAQEPAQDALTALEGLLEQGQVTQAGVTLDCPPEHPGEHSADQSDPDQPGPGLRQALGAGQHQALAAQRRAQVPIGAHEVVAEAEQAQFHGRLPGGQHPGVIPGAAVAGGTGQPPGVAAAIVAQDDKQGGQGAGQQGQGQPGPVGEQDQGQGDQGDAVLEHPAQVLQQGHRAVEGLVAGLVEVVVEGRRVIEGQVQGHGLAVHQVVQMVLDPLPLGGADIARQGIQGLTQDQQTTEQGTQGHQGRQSRPVRRCPVQGCGPLAGEPDQGVDQRAGEPHQGRGQHPLHQQHRQPGPGPGPRGTPDQGRSTGQVADLEGEALGAPLGGAGLYVRGGWRHGLAGSGPTRRARARPYWMLCPVESPDLDDS